MTNVIKIEDKVLILKFDSRFSDNIFRNLKNNNIQIANVYKKNSNFLFRTIRSFHRRCSFPVYKIWYAEWINKVSDFDTILILDVAITDYLITWILKKNYRARIIIWNCNPFFDGKIYKNDKIKYWSFDRKDCTNYGFKYNSTFYNIELICENYNTYNYDILLDVDNMNDQNTFLKSNYKIINKKTLEFYDVNSWSKRFYSNELMFNREYS